MGVHGLGRKAVAERFDSPLEYLNKHIFPIKDMLDQFKKEEAEALKKYNAAINKKHLQQQKLDWAYSGLERWRRE